jgi:hypothetical protein
MALLRRALDDRAGTRPEPRGQLLGGGDTLVGATRERTTTALGELARHELIELRRGKILIRDPARLAAFAD